MAKNTQDIQAGKITGMKKKPYLTPVLKQYGEIKHLTAGGWLPSQWEDRPGGANQSPADSPRP